MRSFLLACGATAAIAACGGTSVNLPDGGDDDSGAPVDGAAPDGGGSADGGGGACGAASVALTFGNCPAPPTCGGAIADGTWVYTAGCLPDPWAQAKTYCKALVVSGEQGTVRSCVTFSGATVSRDVSASYSAKLDYPTACLLGGTCTTLEAYLKPYFTQASCAPSATGCSCAVSSKSSGTVSTGFTLQNNQVVTSANGHYDYCVSGATMGMRYASGPSPEPGIYTLTKK